LLSIQETTSDWKIINQSLKEEEQLILSPNPHVQKFDVSKEINLFVKD